MAFAGRLVAEKGLDVLLRATRARCRTRELLVVGDGPMMPAYRDLVEELSLSLRVSFLGSQPFDGVAEAYARASVVCVPTVCEEAFGFAAAEAMAMRRPLVVTPSGALAELCADGRGFVADDRSPQALAVTLRKALADEVSGLREPTAGASSLASGSRRIGQDPSTRPSTRGWPSDCGFWALGRGVSCAAYRAP